MTHAPEAEASTEVASTQDVAWLRLDVGDFARLFGTTIERIPEDCLALIMQGDFRYRHIAQTERDRIILSITQRIESGLLSIAGPEGRSRWEEGWTENLRNLVEGKCDVRQLVPKYIRPGQPVRLYQDYVLPYSEGFELDWYAVFRRWIFQEYLREFDYVYEFGCGSGFNLATMAQMYPDKYLVGLDWAAASRGILNKLAEAYGWKLEGRFFDFFDPDESLLLRPGSAVMTIGALEQTGDKYEPFLQYLLRSRPALCLHVEPMIEWYDGNNLVDYLAIRFHRARRYWEGFSNRLRELESEGRVEIIKMTRSYFGSLFLEGYSQTIWRVK